MKRVKIFLPILIALAIGGTNLSGQTFTVLHAFATLSIGYPQTNSDGANPAGLLLSDGTLYGTAGFGGDQGSGAVFSMDTNGAILSELHAFAGIDVNGFTQTNADGFGQNGLIRSENTLYGTSGAGGTNGSGTVFSVNLDGSNFTVLYTFSALIEYNSLGVQTNSDGALDPENISTLVFSGNRLYGTATSGGTNGCGTIFSLCTNGTGFSVLHTFAPLGNAASSYPTNCDGGYPQSSLLLVSNSLYGVAGSGGTNGNGVIFSVNTNGTGFNVLYTFSPSTFNESSAGWSGLESSSMYTNYDGAIPVCSLVASGDTLYGATYSAGLNGNGTVFQINADGTGFTTLHAFGPGIDPVYFGSDTNLEGAAPHYLLLSGKTLLGSTLTGGINGNGTVFSISTNGADFILRHTFYGSTDGADPCALALSGNTLYGIAASSGPNNNGTIFSVAIVPVITGLSLAGTNVVITMANSITGGTNTLLTSTDLTLPLSQWTPVATNVLGGGGSFTITNAVDPAVPYQFYTLLAQ